MDYTNNVYATNEFLIKFLENLLFNGKNELKNRYMHVSLDTVNDTVNSKNDTVFSLLKQNNKITANEIATKLGIGIATVKRKLKSLKDRKIIERVGEIKQVIGKS